MRVLFRSSETICPVILLFVSWLDIFLRTPKKRLLTHILDDRKVTKSGRDIQKRISKKVLPKFLIEMYGSYAEMKSPGISVSG